MYMNNNIAIVVIAFNRPNSLDRLLGSINKGIYKSSDIPLVISVDFQDTESHAEVIKIAKEFKWDYGEKRVIEHQQNLGLRKHVISCGDLVNDYDSVILLEDDLLVSSCFYQYSVDALNFYAKDESIAGISLYNHKRNFMNLLPFQVIPDDFDVYFLQIASSWGQAWSKGQWTKFKSWYENVSLEVMEVLPAYIKDWPESSWLKYFISYMVSQNKFFVYPVKSLTTNFSDSGTHNLGKNVEYQVPLSLSGKFRFVTIEDSVNVYDVSFEILPKKLKLLVPNLKDLDVEIDLYGEKNLEKLRTKYLLSSKYYKGKPLQSYALEVKPMLMNIIMETPGSAFVLGEKDQFKKHGNFKITNTDVFHFFYSKVPMMQLFSSVLERIKRAINKK